MKYFGRSCKAYTLIEIMISSLVLALVSAGVYAAMVAQLRLTGFSINELEANRNAAAWLERVKATKQYSELADLAPVSGLLNDAFLYEDYSAWPLADQVDNLQAKYTIEEKDLSPGATFAKPTKITVEVTWEERGGSVSRKALY